MKNEELAFAFVNYFFVNDPLRKAALYLILAAWIYVKHENEGSSRA